MATRVAFAPERVGNDFPFWLHFGNALIHFPWRFVIKHLMRNNGIVFNQPLGNHLVESLADQICLLVYVFLTNTVQFSISRRS